MLKKKPIGPPITGGPMGIVMGTSTVTESVPYFLHLRALGRRSRRI